MPAGRPTNYTVERGLEICAAVAKATTEGLIALCAKGYPFPVDPSTIYDWLHDHPEFSQSYARACASRAENLAAEGFDIVDNGSNDWMERNFGEQTAWVINGEAVQRSKLRADYRLRVMQSLDPARWSQKQQVEHSGSIDLNLNIRDMAVEDILAEIRDLMRMGFVPTDDTLSAVDDFEDLG
jgi:hypothetical protein